MLEHDKSLNPLSDISPQPSLMLVDEPPELFGSPAAQLKEENKIQIINVKPSI